MSPKLYQRVYLSPHLDDVALSCGGLVYQQDQDGLSVLVLTTFAGDAPRDAGRTPIVAELHSRWELESSPNPVAVRRSEDQAAISTLKADVLHWEWPECVYRRHPDTGRFLYPSEASLWGSVHPAEQGLSAQLAQAMSSLPLTPDGWVYVPLTVGGHIDHHIVRQAAEIWGSPKGNLIYYEEYPYAEHPEALKAVLGDRSGWQAEIVPLDKAALDVKADAIARYRSQISTFFANKDEIATRVRAYAATVSEGRGWAERYWHRI